MAVMIILMGGAACIVPLPPSLINALVTACNACKQQRREAKKTSHVGTHPAMPSRGNFQGKSYQDFKDPTLRVGAVRLHGE